MKYFNALANRKFLVLVAIVASAVTLQVRQHMTDTTVQTMPSHTQEGRMCAPSSSARGDTARALCPPIAICGPTCARAARCASGFEASHCATK